VNDLALLIVHVRHANRAVTRNPLSTLLTIAFPLVFLVLFSSLFGASSIEVNGVRLRGYGFTLAGIVTTGIVGSCYMRLGVGMTFAREGGVLKRLRATPLPTWTYLTAHVIQAVLASTVVMGVSTTFSAVVFQVPVSPHSVLALLVALAAGSACFSALGLAVTAASPSADASLVIVNVLVWPLLFASNVFIPIPTYPRWLDVATGVLPVRHLAAAIRTALTSASGTGGLATADLLGLAAWTLIGLVLALRFFSWEPRRSG